jgi:UDP-glucuronate 4-epimerase
MRVLVTGAAGFIGSSVSATLSSSGHEVLGIDNYSDYYSIELKKRRVKEFLSNSNVTFQEIDISQFEEISDSIKKFRPNAVINLAAQAGVRLPVGTFNKYISSNVIGFTNVARASLENGVQNFLYASSSSVYGDKAKLPYSEVEEALHPSSYYGTTKRFNELTIPSLFANSETKARGLRFFTVYGPWGRPDMAYFRMIANIYAGTQFEMFGNGEIERDFTFIEDVSSSVKDLLAELSTRDKGFSDVVNIGGGRPLSMNYLAKLIADLSGQTIEIQAKPGVKEDAARTMSDPSYLFKLIGKQPMTKLEDGIAKTLGWASKEVSADDLLNWVDSTR